MDLRTVEDIKQTINDARNEILQLRRHNEILSAKVAMVELMAGVNRPPPMQQPNTVAVDMAWQLARTIDVLDKEMLPQAAK